MCVSSARANILCSERNLESMRTDWSTLVNFFLKSAKIAMLASKLLACPHSVEALGSFPRMPQLYNATSRRDCDTPRSVLVVFAQPRSSAIPAAVAVQGDMETRGAFQLIVHALITSRTSSSSTVLCSSPSFPFSPSSQRSKPRLHNPGVSDSTALKPSQSSMRNRISPSAHTCAPQRPVNPTSSASVCSP